jgi:hypothetical protein
VVSLFLCILALVSASARADDLPVISSEHPEAGLTIDRYRAPEASPAGVGDGIITVVRLDPSRFAPRLFTAARDGGARPLPAWARAHGLAAAINASMFLQDGRSVTLMIQDGVARQTREPDGFGGFFAFGDTSAAFLGNGCPGFQPRAMRRRYRSIVQNYRLLDCGGHAIRWADEKLYSAAAIGMDREGRFALVHSRTPFHMRSLAAMLASPNVGLRHLHYVEGGPEASLVAPGLELVGSYETGFNENDDNRTFYELPNVIGFVRR